MRADLGDAAALVEDDDLVGCRDRVELVGDDDEGRVAPQGCHGVCDARFILGVERARGLVEENDGRSFQVRTCDGDALAFAAGQRAASLPDGGVPAKRQAFDDLVDSAQAGRFLNVRPGSVGVSDAHVSLEGVVEEVDVLEDKGQLRHEVGRVPIPNVPTANEHASSVHVVEACDEARNGGLATARGAHDRGHGSGFHVEGHALQDRAVGLVGEGHILEGNRCARRGRGLVRASHALGGGQFGCGEDLVAEIQDGAPGFERGGERPDVDKDLRKAQQQADGHDCLHRADGPSDRQPANRADERHDDRLGGHAVDDLANRLPHE